jgi:hypothetical protein
VDVSAPDITDLKDHLDVAQRDAQALVSGLAEERGAVEIPGLVEDEARSLSGIINNDF